MRKIVVLFFMLVNTLLYGQDIEKDTAEIARFISAGQEIYLEKPREAAKLWEEGLSICEHLLPSTNDDSLKRYLLTSKSDLLFNLSQIYRDQGNVVKTVQKLEEALEIDIRLDNRSNISSSYNDLGVIYYDMGLFEKSLDYYLRSLQIDREMKNMQGVASSLINLGYLHSKQGNFEEAENFFEQSLSIQKGEDDTLGMISSLNNLSSVYYSLKEYDRSLEYARRSLKHSSRLNYKSSQANSLSKIGTVFLSKNQIDSATYYMERSLNLRKSINDLEGIFTSAIELANLALKINDLDKALENGNLAYAIAQENNFPAQLMESAKLLANIHSQRKVYDQAYAMQEVYTKNLVETVNSDKSKQLFKKQFEAEYINQRQQDSLINLEKEAINLAERNRIEFEKEMMAEKQEERNRRNQLFLYGALIAFALMLLIIYILVRNNRAKQAANKVIAMQKSAVEKQKTQIEEQHQQLETTHKAISDSIVYAQRLQKAILPLETELDMAFSEHFVLFKPKDVVSGDFYWLHQFDNGDKLVAVADCTGHGVPGAMVSIVCSNALERSIREFGLNEPADILEKSRELVIENYAHETPTKVKSRQFDIRDGMDIALCKFSGDEVTYAGANNPLWIVRYETTSSSSENNDNSGESSAQNRVEITQEACHFIELKADKQPVGKYVSMKPFKQEKVKLRKGDMLFLFSDGFADQFGGKGSLAGKKYKYKPFKKLLSAISQKDMVQQKDVLDQEFQDWKGDFEQIDDLCIMGIRF